MAQKALLISVGGSPEPIIVSINELKPECLCFFASEETRPIINNEILPRIAERPPWMAEIITEDAEDLLACYRSISARWGEIQRNWRLEPGDWVVDYTGGTKTMAAALVLATIDDASGYRYIGGKERTKAGAGIVIDGKEQVLHQLNPWDELAIKERDEAAIIFNRARYKQAAELFQRIEKRVSGSSKPLYKALVDLSDGYALWDGFDYKGAWNKLQAAKKALEMATIFGGPSGLKSLVSALKENILFLEKIVMGRQEVKKEIFFDLLANARRRAEMEHKYDDAISRLYRGIEVYAQLMLAQRGINTSDVKEDQLPDEIRHEFKIRYRDEIDDRIRLPMYASYRLLQALKDPAGATFFERWPQMKLLLDARNRSILAHGFMPIKRERYEEMFKLVLRIRGIEERSLPQFPSLIL